VKWCSIARIARGVAIIFMLYLFLKRLI